MILRGLEGSSGGIYYVLGVELVGGSRGDEAGKGIEVNSRDRCLKRIG